MTADAIYCQKDITKQISKAKADYIFALKHNHKTLYEDVSLWLNTQFDNKKIPRVETIEKTTDALKQGGMPYRPTLIGYKAKTNGQILMPWLW